MTRTHCRHGHAWTEENIYEHPDTGAKLCRLCKLNGMRRLRGKPPVENDRPKIRPKARTKPPLKYCPQGHALTPDNTYRRKDANKPRCRKCYRDAANKRAAELRGLRLTKKETWIGLPKPSADWPGWMKLVKPFAIPSAVKRVA